MEVNKILNADILDIIFEGKNKDYGAYELRKTYNRRITTAMIVMAAVCLLVFLTQLFGSDGDKDKNKIIVQDVQLEDIKKEEKKPEPPPPPPPPKPEPPKVEITKFTPPKIVKDEEVKEPPPPQEKLEETKIGTINQEGKKDEGFVAPPVEEKGTGVVEAPKKVEEDYDKVFTKVEKEAKFPGGMDGWKRYLERNLNANVAADDGAPAGNYTVKVQFIVDKEGGISNVQAIEVPKACPSCGPEAVKVIKKGPKWEPAVQNGRNVIYQAIQYVTFQVAEE
ncbi:energy transducer TonB [Segetibacter aerophilus]|uniref:Biopolymer transporter TonB n=1 Tax=Segetibacter aerophilus TaxID=670293 RepID=A0A512BB01_9BACT|nr:energy transducer TonB [Segetibacter aerophilus]GEO09065.1 biopolymer transporter TonB [Segetibacter aerophilus]